MKILFTCGGTAGHINPAIGVAGRLQELMPDCEILFVGAKGHMETELVPREGYALETVTITNLRRGLSAADIKHNLATMRNVMTAQKEAKEIIRRFQPDVAVGTGGYVCYPVLRAAHALGVPTAVHESNAVPGLTTKMLAGVVDKIMVGFEESRRHYKRPDRVVVTGTPVRRGFQRYDKRLAKTELGLEAEKPLVVSVWGSLGAAHMNEVMVSVIERACQKPFFHLIHSAGTRYYETMCRRLREEGVENCGEQGMDVRSYIYDMPKVMAAADLVLCRSGASTLSELAELGKPAVLVPSPNVTNNHQEKNARVLETAGAAKVLLEGEFSANSLIGLVSELLQDPEQLAEMSRAMAGMRVENATERIADLVLDLAAKE